MPPDNAMLDLLPAHICLVRVSNPFCVLVLFVLWVLSRGVATGLAQSCSGLATACCVVGFLVCRVSWPAVAVLGLVRGLGRLVVRLFCVIQCVATLFV